LLGSTACGIEMHQRFGNSSLLGNGADAQFDIQSSGPADALIDLLNLEF